MTKTTISKNKKGYGYKYTDLAQIHEYLETINSRYIQKIERIDGEDYIMTKRCFDDKWEDEWIQGCRIPQAIVQGIKNPAQELGSALTYARRYSLLMVYGLATEDDDAQSLTTTTGQQTTKTTTKTKSTKEIMIQESQLKILEEQYTTEELTPYLNHLKKKELKELTLTEASSLIKILKEKGEKENE